MHITRSLWWKEAMNFSNTQTQGVSDKLFIFRVPEVWPCPKMAAQLKIVLVWQAPQDELAFLNVLWTLKNTPHPYFVNKKTWCTYMHHTSITCGHVLNHSYQWEGYRTNETFDGCISPFLDTIPSLQLFLSVMTK